MNMRLLTFKKQFHSLKIDPSTRRRYIEISLYIRKTYMNLGSSSFETGYLINIVVLSISGVSR